MSDPPFLASAEPGLCRTCGQWPVMAARCPSCGSDRILRHPDMDRLAIVHLDCDAFYATVEKRDNPALLPLPVIVGGGQRGVVATCCYVARQFGVRSAMPMFKALKLCPQAVVIKPDMAKYKAVSRALRQMMDSLTPVIEPLSIDEAFLDMRGTQKLHGAPVPVVMARFALKVEQTLGISVSVGVSVNKFLAKLASDMNKPRGLTLIGSAQAPALLAPLPVARLWGVGPAAERRLARLGYRTFADLAAAAPKTLLADLGADGLRLAAMARGEDARQVQTERARKSISAEQTFAADIADADALMAALRRSAAKVAASLRAQGLWASSVTLKLKTADFRLRTRTHALPQPRQTARALIDAARPLLIAEADGTPFRLAGLGVQVCGAPAPSGELALSQTSGDSEARQLRLETALDQLRQRFGLDIVGQ